MVRRRRFLAFLLIPALLLALAACSSVRGRTDRYDGYTIRTERSGEAAAPVTETSAPVRTMPGEEAADYVMNKSSMKFHDPSCPGAREIKEQNRWDYHGTRQSALDMGYEPCKICNP